MKVSEIVKCYSHEDLLKDIFKKYENFPKGSISPREVVESMIFPVCSREEAEELIAELDATVTSAILKFKAKKSNNS